MRLGIAVAAVMPLLSACVGAAPPNDEGPAAALSRITTNLPERDRKVLVDAFQQAYNEGYSLGRPMVGNNVAVHAVLLPFEVCRRVFGRETARNYAAIELIVSNRNPDAALIVQSIFIDYSQWALSGRVRFKPREGDTGFEAGTNPAHVASVEYRLVRGQLLEAQPWSARNIFLRSLKAAGSVAAGYQFAFSEQGVIRGIAAFNGQFVPAAEFFWPDSTTTQANRISDVGFQVNKVVPKESSEIVVAFYPIERFLTPGMQKLFREVPALFFAPASLAFDRKVQELLKKYAPDVIDEDKISALREALKAGRTSEDDDTIKFLNSFSLNAVRVVVAGVMSVDVDAVPATTEEITVAGGDSPETWLEPGARTGVVHGRFLGGATLSIVEADEYDISKVAVVADGSTDRDLKFQFTTSKPILENTVLTFRVAKKTKVQGKDKPLDSNPYLYRVAYRLDPPRVKSTTKTGDKIVITGVNFYEPVKGEFQVRLDAAQVPGVTSVTAPEEAVNRKPKEVTIDLTKVKLVSACWTPVVVVRGADATGATPFAMPAEPQITKAKVKDKRVIVTGEGLLDKPCDQQVTFQVLEAKDGAKPKPVTAQLDSATQASFDLPEPAASEWEVQLFVKGQKKTTVKLEK